jgi:serine/threonine-protein kinase
MGSRFGKYHIDRKVAIGGMAEIYQAHSTSGAKVAIKKIHPNLASQTKFVQMFLDEARIVIRLRHPNVVQLLDFGKLGDTYFFSMEWVDGKALSEVVIAQRQQGIPFPIDVALQIGVDVCDGLHYAHSRSDQFNRPLEIVHRDISPPNIMLTREGIVKVADFGIADIRQKTTQTQPGIIRGKFSYMSPEQSRGEVIDRRSDVFSVGIVLYELMMSTRLFLKEKEVDTIAAVRKCDVPSMRGVRGDVSAEAEAAVFKALAANPKNRYASAEEFGMALREVLKRDYPASDRTRITKFLKLLFPGEAFAGADQPISMPVWKSPARTESGNDSVGRVGRWLGSRYVASLVMALVTVLLAELWVQVGQRVLARLR